MTTLVSIIVPALNEAAQISATLIPLQALRREGHEVIVVDGGSGDATLALAKLLADRAFIAPRGRASQMNAGAAVASGDVLLFLHADSRLPEDGIEAIVARLPPSGRHWGRFDIAIASEQRILRVIAWMMNLRSTLTGIATGDQGIFVERGLFASAGGFPQQPLMEDISLSATLKRIGGRPLRLRQRITTSARRWEANGAWRTIVTMWRLRFDYWRGVDPSPLAETYAKLHGRVRASPLPTLQIFAKAPIAGSVKTRLLPTVGAERATQIYRELVEGTLSVAVAAHNAGTVGRVELWCAPTTNHPAFESWQRRFDLTLRLQQDDDLGSRMQHALAASLARGTPAILIGTDCAVLDAKYLAWAAAALEHHDAVFGPAEDGGYVLVGLRRPIEAFDGINWGMSDVMAATRERLREQHVDWHELPVLWDVDVAADVERWRALAELPA